jgi:hypothetical protein
VAEVAAAWSGRTAAAPAWARFFFCLFLLKGLLRVRANSQLLLEAVQPREDFEHGKLLV